jgi:hypothetical protein
MATEIYRDPDLEWLDHVPPVGLVVAPTLLKELGLSPLRQTPIDTGLVGELIRSPSHGLRRLFGGGLSRLGGTSGRRLGALARNAAKMRYEVRITMSAIVQHL